ncbi:MAG: pyridoxamine kinase, partial [Oscillospiraceae bacterium]|jgi:pyridoxine kinase|nr:pyridoxamine kinase [Oscillospiraceae bacterium]
VIQPILSMMGVQACPVPTAILAAHTGGFGEVVMKDSTEFIPAALAKYRKLKINFDAVYSGFLASEKQIDHCLDFFRSYPNSLKIVDPVMGDHGKVYSTYTPELCARMCELAQIADIITPNVTEAAILLGEEYPQKLTREMVRDWLGKLQKYAPAVVITGVPLENGEVANACFNQSGAKLIKFDYIPQNYPGTGDMFTAVLTGGLLKGEELHIAVNRAAIFTQAAIRATFERGTTPRNGVIFEEFLSLLAGEHKFLKYEEI